MYPASSEQWLHRQEEHDLRRQQRELQWEQRMAGEDLSIALDEEEDEPEPECECIQVDVDELDARYCPAHGPRSEAHRRSLAAEAAAEAAYWSHPGWAEVFAEGPARKPAQSTAAPAAGSEVAA